MKCPSCESGNLEIKLHKKFGEYQLCLECGEDWQSAEQFEAYRQRLIKEENDKNI